MRQKAQALIFPADLTNKKGKILETTVRGLALMFLHQALIEHNNLIFTLLSSIVTHKVATETDKVHFTCPPWDVLPVNQIDYWGIRIWTRLKFLNMNSNSNLIFRIWIKFESSSLNNNWIQNMHGPLSFTFFFFWSRGFTYFCTS